MIMLKFILLSLFACTSQLFAHSKIIGLVAVRNESIMIRQCLKALSLYTDAIIVLDDYSTDNTVEIIQSLAHECRIEKIITKDSWYRNESGDKYALLNAGRALGGTHFIVIDADEMFTANCLDNHCLRNAILALQPGDQLALTWIQLWRSTQQYRFDSSIWTNKDAFVIFCDEPQAEYDNRFLHTSRIPRNLSGKQYTIPGYDYGLLHFQFVNWDNVLIKHAWYRCLERIRAPHKSIAEINSIYGASTDEKDLKTRLSPSNWFTNYSFFDPVIFEEPEKWRKVQVKEWFAEYGTDAFKELDIWDINWN